MGLETFQFIPDLVDTNPEPTDPVAQGDDHIRGIKFTLQTQWPVIGEDAVTRTALQMNDAALRSEVNTFTQTNFMEQPIQGGDGVASFPMYTFDSESTTGMYKEFAGVISFSLAGTRHVQFAAGANTWLAKHLIPNGSASNPSYSFTAAPNMGLFQKDANTLGFSAGGFERFAISTNIAAQVVYRGPDGAVSGPAYSFSGATSTGMWNEGNALNFSTLGVKRLQMEFGQMLQGNQGSATAPAYSFVADPDTGMHNPQANTIDFDTAGVSRFRISTVAIQPTLRQETLRGSVALPAYSFFNQSNCGMSLPVNNELTFSCGASRQFIVRNNTIAAPLLPTSQAGLVAGDCWRNPTAPGFVAIV